MALTKPLVLQLYFYSSQLLDLLLRPIHLQNKTWQVALTHPQMNTFLA